MAPNLHSQKGADQKFSELGQSGDCETHEAEFKI